jgi:hypothetical protein
VSECTNLPWSDLAAGRNQAGLTDKQIEYCEEVWEVLCADRQIVLDVSETGQNFSRTRFSEAQNKVFLGADAFPGEGVDANSRMSTLACLAHELAHAERFQLGYRHPAELPRMFCWTKPRPACVLHSLLSSERKTAKTWSKMREIA